MNKTSKGRKGRNLLRVVTAENSDDTASPPCIIPRVRLFDGCARASSGLLRSYVVYIPQAGPYAIHSCLARDWDRLTDGEKELMGLNPIHEMDGCYVSHQRACVRNG